ncbi:hypothetical protein Taro_031031 [Colocasia esculenta]|uniref:Uncharacterized protein n=1 Tax=Colocasia esculenta TaxID=4460 RepID=A0A843VZN1_COLES|nr:hypothetical protein [Colocasia esculenta]
MNLELSRVVWRSSWWLRSCGTTTRSRSSSPSRLLRPAQTTLLKSTKDSYLLLHTSEIGVPVLEEDIVRSDSEREE